MQVSNPNNVKIYNLSAGKSIPDWLSEKRRRKLQKSDVEYSRRISLLQDFEMPSVSNCVQVTPDKQYVFVTGVYKPRVRCFDMSQMSMKFERCFDEAVVKFRCLSDDYSKVVFLQADRYIEFHVQHGKYYRTRIPKYGRDLAFHAPTSDLYTVGASNEVYRLNLEQGRFMRSLKTNASEIFCCEFNKSHQLFTCGTKEGSVECWDPRVRNRVGTLDCIVGSLAEEIDLSGTPAVTSLKYRDALTLGVGTSTGQILLYDIRSNKPLLIKDHNCDLPIQDIEFCEETNHVLSCDRRILKIWDRISGKPFTSIEPENTKLSNLCTFPDSGLLFIANEAPKVLTYYIPSLGPAPKWCSFLDNLTEELEESNAQTVYDDYKFVSRTELENLGLAHLVGSNLLRAYMHGYFMDSRLYKKAKSIADPFAYEEYRRNKIRAKIEESRKNRVQIKPKLPKVNKVLAEKLLDIKADVSGKKKKQVTTSLLEDNRFKAMFEDRDFEIDAESEDYQLINPLVSKLEKERQMIAARNERFQPVDEDDDDERKSSSGEESSDDEHTWTEELKKTHRMLAQKRKQQRMQENMEELVKPKFYEIKDGHDLKAKSSKDMKKQKSSIKRSLGDRVEETEDSSIIKQSGHFRGNVEMTFKTKRSANELKYRKEALEHHKERRKIRRSANSIIKPKRQSQFFSGRS